MRTRARGRLNPMILARDKGLIEIVKLADA
jgi:hypothetical protein